MCYNWRKQFFKNFDCFGTVEYNNKGDLTVSGKVNTELTPNSKLLYWAPAPPTYMSNFSGSALPYANPLQAFENTPNKGVVNITNGIFSFQLYYPNAYYSDLGTTYNPPQIMFKICPNDSNLQDRIHILTLDDGIPYRMLTYPSNYNVMFYDNIYNLPIRNQESILRDSSYPSNNKMPTNHWGLKPSL
tara:strand:+ start:1189 stop:1752 length:564 start_codon:yes stop_codon:yes gene_type:complete